MSEKGGRRRIECSVERKLLSKDKVKILYMEENRGGAGKELEMVNNLGKKSEWR